MSEGFGAALPFLQFGANALQGKKTDLASMLSLLGGLGKGDAAAVPGAPAANAAQQLSSGTMIQPQGDALPMPPLMSVAQLQGQPQQQSWLSQLFGPLQTYNTYPTRKNSPWG